MNPVFAEDSSGASAASVMAAAIGVSSSSYGPVRAVPERSVK